MTTINPVGIAACLTPGVRGSNGTYTCDLYLMAGDMPPAELLTSISSAVEMTTNFPVVAYKFSGLSIFTDFSFWINQRSYKKTPVDALNFIPIIAGSIKWAALVFPGEKIMFTDSIGLWDDLEASITLNSLEADPTKENILKDINLLVRDVSTYELYPNGIFNTLPA